MSRVRNFPGSRRDVWFASLSYASNTHLNASSGESEAALTAFLVAVFQDRYDSGFGKSGKLIVSASLTLGLLDSSLVSPFMSLSLLRIAIWASKRPVLRASDVGAPRPAARGAVTLGAFATDGPAIGVPGKDGDAVTPPGFIDSNREYIGCCEQRCCRGFGYRKWIL